MRLYSGEIAGVVIKDGVPDNADVVALEDRPARARAILGYAQRQGLVVDDEGRLCVPEATDPEPVDPRTIGTNGDGITPVGTRLRDAAVDPKPGDFLPPTNAGEANPHGPDVVAPGIHGVEGVRPVRPGPVAVGNPAVQETAETTHAAAATGVAAGRPAKNAGQAAWAAYATSLGAIDAEDRSRAELIELYGSDDGGEEVVEAGEGSDPVGTEVPGSELGSDPDQLVTGPSDAEGSGEQTSDDVSHED